MNAITGREGARSDTTGNVIAFRMRWLDGVTLENRINDDGRLFKIIAINDIGRRVGLDIRRLAGGSSAPEPE
jgi:hypothetical protein